MNQGGHGAIRPIGDGSILAKAAPQGSIENEFYSRIRANDYPQLTAVVPASYTADQVREHQQLTPDEVAIVDDRTHVFFENIAQGDVKKLDTKIGAQSSSFRELKAQHGMSSAAAALKSIKLSIADLSTGSVKRGWRVVGGDDARDSRLRSGIESQSILRKFSDEPQVWDQLIGKMEGIRDAAQQTDIGFVASSVFSVQGTHNDGQVVEAKLIDFAHVIDADKPFTRTPDVSPVNSPQNSPEHSPRMNPSPAAGNDAGRTATAQGTSQSSVNWPQMKNKYRDLFIDGMNSLINDAKTVRAEKQQTMAAAAANIRASGATVSASSAAAATPPPGPGAPGQQAALRK
ncbi:hypothetical protein ACH492_28210 [Streptomyces sp. NPDC019443]|uniref:hypothetical protein n=1 Tax=Streptomyces sp. NPDC019443 TaxID=3365061 RepID=UPI00379D2D07